MLNTPLARLLNLIAPTVPVKVDVFSYPYLVNKVVCSKCQRIIIDPMEAEYVSHNHVCLLCEDVMLDYRNFEVYEHE